MPTNKFSRGEKLQADKEQAKVDMRLHLGLKFDLDVDLDRGFQDTKTSRILIRINYRLLIV